MNKITLQKQYGRQNETLKKKNRPELCLSRVRHKNNTTQSKVDMISKMRYDTMPLRFFSQYLSHTNCPELKPSTER